MSSSSWERSITDVGSFEPPSDPSFQCCVCLDLLYKPVVLACGHMSCFWCVQKGMHGLRASRCAICRRAYNHFPSICGLIHLLLMKMEPEAYKSRENEILEEERANDCFSTELVDHLFTQKVDAVQDDSNTIEEIDHSSRNLDAITKQVSVTDVLCAGCNELLIRPSVLNCGHVYCESCISCPIERPPKCQVCQRLHPGNSPSVCWELDNFIEENFSKEYATRRTTLQLKNQLQHGDPSLGGVSETWKHDLKSSRDADADRLGLNEDLSNSHVGVGCDSCGIYPIIGKRYNCKDCKEKVGFDLCEACYRTSSKLPGRFNQRHKPDHRLELDDSRMLSKLLDAHWLSSRTNDSTLDSGLGTTI